MARTVFAAAALATMATISSVQAADIPRGSNPYYTAPAPLAYYSWAGPYLGVNVGYQWGEVTNNPNRPKGIAGGVQGGINWQVGQFVLGAATDLHLSSADATFPPCNLSTPSFSPFL